ncbi:MAG: LamG domain-containing protein [Chloroflexi bacterium]|nr:LamG domain-containing protein [Chloroflexota bacterium]
MKSCIRLAAASPCLLAISCAAQSTNCAPPPQDLIGWWRAEGDADDAMGDNNGALRNGAIFVLGLVNQAFDFNGVNQFVEVPNSASLNPAGSFTIEGWIFPRRDRVQIIVGKWGDTGDTPNQRSYMFHTRPGGGLQFSISDAANQWKASFHLFESANGVVTLNTWIHVAAVYDQPAGTRRIYVNGIKVAERVHEPITILNGTSKLGIGTSFPSSTTSADYFDGLIDELSLYARALSQSELLAIYNAGAAGKCPPTPPPPCVPPPSVLAGWWSAEGSAKDIHSTNNGILKGGASYESGKVGAAFSLNGSTAYVEVPDSDLWAFGASNFSIELWVNFRALNPSSTIDHPAAVFVANDEGYYIVNKWFFSLGGGRLCFLVAGPTVPGQAQFLVQAPFVPTLNQWYHLAVVRDGNVFTIYRNGVAIGSQSSSVVIPNANAPLTIGQGEGLFLLMVGLTSCPFTAVH